MIGATNAISVNDGAQITVTSTAEQVLSKWGNIAAFGPSSAQTSLGVQSSLGVVWSGPSLLMRGGALEFYKSQTALVTAQSGTVFRQQQENRASVNLRQEPTWTVSMTAPDSGTDLVVDSHRVVTLPSGNYGNVIVNSFGELDLTGTSYGFVSLTVNERGTVNFTASQPPRVFVRNDLTLRNTFGKPGTILGYLGTNTAHLEGDVTVVGSFIGDILVAPNASVEIRRDVVGRIFAKNVTVFEGQTVRGVPFLSSTLDWLRPTESVVTTPKGLFSTAGSSEIASALLTPAMNSSCSADRAFVSYSGASVMHKAVSAIGTTTAAVFPAFPGATPAPSACLDTWMPLLTHAWPIVPGGTAYYSDTGAFTDNLMTRMSGGRVVHAGFSGRRCTDAVPSTPNAAACPASQPSNDDACSPTGLANAACLYGTTQCQCLPTGACGTGPRQYGAGGLGGTYCTDGSQCCSGTWSLGSTLPGTCTNPSPLPSTTWVCGPLDRTDAGIVGIRMSTDCGSTWTAGPFDPSALGVHLADGALGRIVDRPELFWDKFGERLYVNANTYAGPGGAGSPDFHNVVYSASTAGITSASNLAWQPVAPQLVALDDDVYGPRVMTTALDERARLDTTPPSFNPYVHLVAARCFGTQPQVQIWTPFGRKTWDLSEGISDTSVLCRQVGRGDNGQQLEHLQFGPSVAAVSSVPPRVRVAYTGIAGTGADAHTVIDVFTVTIKTADNYAVRPDIVREPTIDVTGRHSVWPQLIAVDGLGNSARQVDSPMVLRWSELSGQLVRERAQVLYSSSVRGPVLTLSVWSVVDTFPGIDCLDPNNSCFVGDYKYGAFFTKTGSSLRFFTPWTGGGTDPGTGNPIGYTTTSGAFIDVVP